MIRTCSNCHRLNASYATRCKCCGRTLAIDTPMFRTTAEYEDNGQVCIARLGYADDTIEAMINLGLFHGESLEYAE